MKKRRLLPAILCPYLVALSLSICMVAANFDSIFFNALILGFIVIVFVNNRLILLETSDQDVRSMLYGALFVKLSHIPAYFIFLYFGAIVSYLSYCKTTIILMLVLFHFLKLAFSSSISVAALARYYRQHPGSSMLVLICQFFYFADVVSLLIMLFRCRKRLASLPNGPDQQLRP